MTDTITIRPFEERDLGQTLDMLRLALGETELLQRTPQWFRWKHMDNPFGRSIMAVAESDGRIAGLRAFMRWELRTVDGETIRCVRAVDTATHPDHLRRGIFTRLTEKALVLAEEDGVDLVFNTPNEKSGAGYLKMGWSDVGNVGVQVRPSRHLLSRRDIDTVPETPGTDPVAPIQFTDRHARGLRTPRTQEYLRWRFDGHPTAGYRKVEVSDSAAVVRSNIRNGRIELIVSDVFGPNRRAAISEAVARSAADYVVAGFTRSTPERAAAVRSGLVPVPRLSGFHLVARPLRPLPVDVTDLATWDLAVSDLELL